VQAIFPLSSFMGAAIAGAAPIKARAQGITILSIIGNVPREESAGPEGGRQALVEGNEGASGERRPKIQT
jgi:hypothetical protein